MVCMQFLVRQPRSGRLPMEKMDLMNTVNQLLLDNNKLKGDKVALEEEVKTQRRSSVIERVKGSVTARDVALCANNKVFKRSSPSRCIHCHLVGPDRESLTPARRRTSEHVLTGFHVGLCASNRYSDVVSPLLHTLSSYLIVP